MYQTAQIIKSSEKKSSIRGKKRYSSVSS